MRRNILVIDDEEDIVEVFRDRLETYGFRVSTAFSGPEALNELSREKFDCIFLDLRMPDMDGHEVLEHIRSTDKETPIIIITALTNRQEAFLARVKGATDYVLKPFVWKDLESKLKGLYEIEL